VVTASGCYPGEFADVWSACTNPDASRALVPPVSGELKEGSRYQLEGNAGGTITRCELAARLRRDLEDGRSPRDPARCGAHLGHMANRQRCQTLTGAGGALVRVKGYLW
jgi:hypothetical protein